LGRDLGAGQRVQFRVPAGTWQAGELLPGGRYALFGCTMAPGFTPECFRASPAGPLVAGWPDRAADIERLAIDEASERTFGTTE
jgi:predicted cupin superfamily sugar epimerase